jgi:hypothetical protein
MKTFDSELSPNPSTIQLFAIHDEKDLKLKFITQRGLFINIVSLYGSSKLYFENEPNDSYSLRGRDDKLSLAVPSYVENVVPSLIIENLNYKEKKDKELSPEDLLDDKPGFAFYIEYYLRSFVTNFDEINLGKTTEVAYKRTDFPLYYFSKLNSLDYSINVFFNLHDLHYTTGNNNLAEEFSIKGSLIEQKIAYKIKREEEGSKPNLDNSPIVGIYDPALKAGQVYFSTKNLKELGNSVKDKPTLYLSIEKGNEFKFSQFRMELTAFQENSNVPVTEKLYQYGKIYDKNTVNFYKLKVDNSVPGYMRVQFATNNANIRFVINNERNKKELSKYDEYDKKNNTGKTLITFKKPKDRDFIYLNVYLEKAENDDIKTNHYAFKYINSEKKDLFFEYNIENNPKIEVTQGDKDITVKFNKIKIPSTAEVTYYIKVIKPDDYINNEIINTISLTESKAQVTPVTNINNPIKIPKVDFKYIQVIGYIKDGPINEYVAYNAYAGAATKAGGSTNKTLVIVVGVTVVLFIVAIVLVVIVIFFNAKNKDLMDKVNKISFINADDKANGEVNLLSGDNELK